MGQTAITTFPPGLYTGQLDTVYFNASAPLSSVINTWMSFTLDSAFDYNPAQSLVIQISHCGFSGSGMSVWQKPGTTGIIRRNNIPGNTSCIFTYSSQDTRTLQCGIDISFVGIEPAGNVIPKGYSLEQNYPNPFNPSTKINFSIPQSGFTSLVIYDVMGREVRTLINSQLRAGKYSIDFNADDLTSGAYMYKLKVNDFTETRKMMLIK
jgi:hypothetical protein